MDLPSEDESDVDYVPEGENSNSEVESEADADKETDEQFENELAKKKQKRAASKASKKRPKKRAKLEDAEEVAKIVKTNDKPSSDPEQTKKYEDDLWASFLGTPSHSSKSVTVKDEPAKSTGNSMDSESPIENGKEKNETDPVTKAKETKLEEKPPLTTSSPSVLSSVPGRPSMPPSLPFVKKPAGGGLASVLSKIGKKDKMGTLEKSKLDWMTFKKDEGIDEEIQTFNRGKSGYLERQDFLQRTDLRQFEIEKNMRVNKRSNR